MEPFEILRFEPCREAIIFRAKFASFEEAWNNCHRGDWLLWIASMLNIDSRIMSLAKGLCANTVIHLMKDKRSVAATLAAIAYGEGRITKEELNAADADAAAAAAAAAATAAAANANAAADAATAAAYANAAAAADAADAAAYAAYANAAAADAAAAAAAAAYANAAAADAYANAAAADAADAAAYAAAMKKNRLETANICRTILTEHVFRAINTAN